MYSATADHLSLAPPQQGRWLGPVGLALIAHGLLVAALTWGVGWKTDAPPVVFEAELWSSLPQQAAPREVEPPPPPPAPEPPPSRPEPRPAPAPSTPPPAERQADIATAQAKKKAEAERKAREEAAARKAAADKATAEKLAADKKAALDKKAAAEKERQQKLTEQKRQQERQQATEKREAALAAQQREEQLRRILGQAGASGGALATGTAQQSSGPSAGYEGRLAAHVKPNVVFTDVIAGNPQAEVEVRALPDGTITLAKLYKSSGNRAWDTAAVRAIERTAKLPRDNDGKIPSWIISEFGPQD